MDADVSLAERTRMSVILEKPGGSSCGSVLLIAKCIQAESVYLQRPQ